MSNAQVFARVSLSAMKQAKEYKILAASNARQGKRPPDMSVNIDAEALAFFKSIEAVSQHNQHSQAAAALHRSLTYAAHNSLGKAQI